MAKIVFFCIPAHGHTNPTLGVVRELTDRGHEVWYYSYNAFRERIEAAGAKFVACDDFDAELRLTSKDAAQIGKNLALSTRVLVDTTIALDETVCRDMAVLQPDCIVADSMAVWGKAAAMKLGIPFVSSTTTFAFNQHSAKIMKQNLRQVLGMILSMPRINRDIQRLKDHGYPVKSVLDLIQNDENTHTVVYTSPEFQPCSETFTDRYAFVGPSIRPVLVPFEKTREKLVYISMGTVNNKMGTLYKNCIRALGNTEYQVVISTGQQFDIMELGTLPRNVSVYPYVDQMAVLEQADVFLTHCGMNSASEGLYHSVPLLLHPQTSEQGAVAARTEQLGAGIRLQSISPKVIRQAVDTLINMPTYQENAAAIAAGFRSCPGAKGAADKILSLCK